MKYGARSYLLDTNVAIWLDVEPQLVSMQVHAALADPSCAIFVSAVSFWELPIEQSIGRYDPGLPLELMLARYRVHELAMTSKYTGTVRELPRVHRDLFHRMLVAQAIVEGMTPVTGDARLSGYPVSVLRAQ